MRNVVDFAGAARDRPVRSVTSQCIKVFARLFLRPEMARLRLHHRWSEQVAVDPGIEELWLCPFLRLTNSDFVHSNTPADIALGIVEFSREDRLSWADKFAT